MEHVGHREAVRIKPSHSRHDARPDHIDLAARRLGIADADVSPLVHLAAYRFNPLLLSLPPVILFPLQLLNIPYLRRIVKSGHI